MKVKVDKFVPRNSCLESLPSNFLTGIPSTSPGRFSMKLPRISGEGFPSQNEMPPPLFSPFVILVTSTHTDGIKDFRSTKRVVRRPHHKTKPKPT